MAYVNFYRKSKQIKQKHIKAEVQIAANLRIYLFTDVLRDFFLN